jgi:hypothetical protein
MIDYESLKEGDIYFRRTGLFNRDPSVCGFIFKPFGGKLFYCAEINSEGKLKFYSMHELNIFFIRRDPLLFKSEEDRIKFRKHLLALHEYLILSDVKYFGTSVDFVASEMLALTDNEEFVLNPTIDFLTSTMCLLNVGDD